MAAQEPVDLLIREGRLIDGTGNPWLQADVAVNDGRIVAVGQLRHWEARETISARGRFVAPGFVDIHSHAGDQGVSPGGARGLLDKDPRYRAAPNLVGQGATTVVINQDGRSPWPIRRQLDALEELGHGPNALALVGHGTVRTRILRGDFRRAATQGEVAAMVALVEEALEDGAFGLSTGLEYSPMIWSTTDEVVALVKPVERWNGIYVVHERSSGQTPMWWWPSQDDPDPPTILDAVAEAIEVAERTGVRSVQTHLKARGADAWGVGQQIVDLIDDARKRGVPIWADAYSYNTTGSDGSTVLIPRWVIDRARRTPLERSSREGSDEVQVDYAAALSRLMQDELYRDRIRSDVEHEISRRGTAEQLMVVEARDQSLVGRRLSELAAEAGTDPVTYGIQLQLEGDPHRPGGVGLRGFSLSEDDVAVFHSQPWLISASDAGVALPDGRLVHPRFYGNFPRKIRRYALDLELVPVESAIRSMTSLPALVLGLEDRGLVRPGHWADLVIFDPETLADRATPLDPHQLPTGIDWVFVNGQAVVERGELTWALPGRVVRNTDRPSFEAPASRTDSTSATD